VPLLEDGLRVYAIGDVHGRLDLLERMHGLIAAELTAWPVPRAVVVHLGDYVDRGPQSAGVVERLLDLSIGTAEIVCLKGNHEDCLLQFLDGSDGGATFLHYGGLETMTSYGVEVAALNERGDFGRLAVAFAAHLPSRHRDFYETLPHSHQIGGYFFCHAGVRPGVPLARQTAHDLIWIREPFLGSPIGHGKVIVHGHTPVEAIESLPNRINVDTGAVFTGRLSAVALEGNGRRFVSVDGTR
jgi:serine/threonine protein phosphatase 1